ncbi:UDP-glycosyltransferase UGT5-like isoform X2 [Periplaneta americana]|uniref:UDP-glycosyltransferase UGT5-like isoform X2 n=1 Tax=Periplaneta americana TaxID=6978 RepID=UPI0037E7C226
MKALTFLLMVWSCDYFTSAYRILALMPHYGKSHFDVFEPYFKELAARGHQIVVVSHFPQKQPVANYSDISLEGSIEIGTKNSLDIGSLTGIKAYVTFAIEALKFLDSCRRTLAFNKVQQLLRSEEKFDVVIVEIFYTDCYIAFAHKFEASLIGVSTSLLFSWGNDRMGSPDNPSHIPVTLTGSSHRMNFRERLINSAANIALRAAFLVQAVLVQMFVNSHIGPDVPWLSEIARNTSLVLVNTHFSLNWPRPLVPGVVEVGGIHIKPAKKLQKDLESYLNDAKHGVIYFSMGSLMRGDTLPQKTREAFMQAFSELPQRVLWKWEGEDLPGQPPNVKTMSWLPQFDVLNHPNLVLFICHAGILSVIEAVHAGVPVLGIPVFGDQFVNVRTLEEAGIGLELSLEDITKEVLLEALKTMLETPSYSENAKRMSALYVDRPMSAMDTAIFWTEYVMRHKGAPHIHSPALDLYWYQYLLLDVIFVLLLFSVVFLLIVYIVLKMLVKMINRFRKFKTD